MPDECYQRVCVFLYYHPGLLFACGPLAGAARPTKPHDSLTKLMQLGKCPDGPSADMTQIFRLAILLF